jgi:hypothetical protein
MNLWRVQGTSLQEIKSDILDDEQRLEDWIVADPSILGTDLLLIGRQVSTANRGRIDLLAINPDANLVVLELKRDMTPREVVAQALDYASWVKELSYEDIENISQGFLKKPLREAFSEQFGFAMPQVVNSDHSIIILASQLDDSSERIVEYLAEQYNVPINVLFFTFFNSKEGEFLARAWLKDPEELQEHAQSKKQAPWSGFYYVNVGENECRNWDDCRKYGFLTAGQGVKASYAMKKLKEGDLVFAYMKNLGYVGFGKVTKPAVMARDFVVEKENKKLLDLPLKATDMAENKDDPDMAEWPVGIEWKITFNREDAKTFHKIFANQNIVCLLRDTATVDFLKKEFGVA